MISSVNDLKILNIIFYDSLHPFPVSKRPKDNYMNIILQRTETTSEVND